MITARHRNELSHTCAFCLEACVLPKNGKDDALLTCSKCKKTVHEQCWSDYKTKQFESVEIIDNEDDLIFRRRQLVLNICRCPSCRSTLKLAGRPRPMDETEEFIERFDNDTAEAHFTRTPSLKKLSLQRQIKKARMKVTFWSETFEKYPWIQNVENAIEHRKKAEAHLQDLQKKATQKRRRH